MSGVEENGSCVGLRWGVERGEGVKGLGLDSGIWETGVDGVEGWDRVRG